MAFRRPKRSVLLLPGWHDPRTIVGIGRYARKANWHLHSRNVFDGSIPHGWRGDGVLVSCGARAELNRFAADLARRIPTVMIGANRGGIEAPYVEIDNRAAGRAAALHFLERGYRQFAWFSLGRGPVEQDRFDGFRLALREAGRTCTLLRWQGRSTSLLPWADCRRFLTGHLVALPKPLGLLALDDQLASDAIEVCLDARLRVPQDVAVMGIGNIELACEFSQVPISSIDIDFEELGYRAAALLGRLMTGRKVRSVPVRIPIVGVILRRSTEALAVQDPRLLRAIRHVEAHYDQPLVVSGLAAVAGTSRRALEMLFACEMRCSPAKFLSRVRTRHALKRLRETDTKIPAIALACGFGSIRNLNRTLQRELGMSARAYRRQSGATS